MSFRNKGRVWGPAHFPWLTVLASTAVVGVLALERPWERATVAAERTGADEDAMLHARRALFEVDPNEVAPLGPAPGPLAEGFPRAPTDPR